MQHERYQPLEIIMQSEGNRDVQEEDEEGEEEKKEEEEDKNMVKENCGFINPI